MNIIIPSAGIGQRFQDDGYTMPKPLISVLGEPMIFHVIRSLNVADKIYIPYSQAFDKYQFKAQIKRAFPIRNIQFIRVDYPTRGPAETVLCALNQMDDLYRPILIHDYDILFESEIKDGNCIYYFEDKFEKPIYSYLQLKGDQVTDIKEKEKISDNACAGAYGFESGILLKKYIERLLATDQTEYFISGVYGEMLKDNIFIESQQVQDFRCVGTPNQLKAYCMSNTTEKKRFCFDLDNTLVTYPETAGDYATVKPIIKTINLVKYLHKQGHTIIIQTARKMKTAGNNVGSATALAIEQIYKTLNEFEIPFRELHFGKPQADFYIDDLSVKPWDIEKETGFYNGEIEAREFNRIQVFDEFIEKTTNNSGEIYWYKNIPLSIREHFPTVVTINGNNLKVSKINGVNFSYLLCNGSLTMANLRWLLETMEKVHNVNPFQFEYKYGLDFHANYTKKITERFKTYDYPNQAEANEYFNIVSPVNHIPQIGVIHGDPVFSNVFLCDNQLIKFIDMRGKIGDVETIYGDIFYDYAKVYQSLCGYDFILNDMEINYAYLEDLRSYFEKWFTERYGVNLAHITAGLLFSLIPLHTDIEKQKKYFELMKTLV